MTEKAFTDDQATALMERYAKGESLAALAREHGHHPQALRRAFLRNGYTPRRSGRPMVRFADPKLVAEIVRRYEAGESQQAIADSIGTDQVAVSRLLRREGVTMRSRAAWQEERRGAAHPAWRGGRVRYGAYVGVYVERDDPLREMANGDGYIFEHRLVMARSIGRPLRKDESVHHINGQRDDNRLENLQLRTGLHGKHVAFVCADCGSSNVVPRSLME